MTLSTNCSWSLLILFFVCSTAACEELISPCPDIFQYYRNQSEPDRWYGTAVLTSDEDLIGVWFRVILDYGSVQLGNWFGDVESRDNKLGYLIRNPTFKLKANSTMKLTFYVRYDPSKPIPKVVSFRLNAVVKCPKGFTHVNDVPIIEPAQPFTNSPDLAPVLNNSTCGTVVKVSNSEETQFPWHAILYTTTDFDLSYRCGATLISLKYLITAAHCVTEVDTDTPLDARKVIVHLGKYYLDDWQSSSIQVRRIEEIKFSKYDQKKLESHLAVLKLTEPVEFTDFVRPICLPQEPENLAKENDGIVVSWGYDQQKLKANHLVKTQVSRLLQTICQVRFPDYPSEAFTNQLMFCGEPNKDTVLCSNNSGSSLFQHKSDSSSENPQWELQGILSVGDKRGCYSSQKLLFINIIEYLHFINHFVTI